MFCAMLTSIAWGGVIFVGKCSFSAWSAISIVHGALNNAATFGFQSISLMTITTGLAFYEVIIGIVHSVLVSTADLCAYIKFLEETKQELCEMSLLMRHDFLGFGISDLGTFLG